MTSVTSASEHETRPAVHYAGKHPRHCKTCGSQFWGNTKARADYWLGYHSCRPQTGRWR